MLFVYKENKNNDFIQQVISVLPLRQLENIRWTQTAYAVLCQPHHTDMFSTFIYALIWAITVLFTWQSMGQSLKTSKIS